MRLNATRLGSIASSRSFGDQLDDLAGQVPSLDLNFAQNKSLIDDYSGTTLVTFTRASSGTYVGSDGVLRTATTNLLTWSEDTSQWFIPSTGITISQNQTTAPTGALTADQYLETATTGLHSQNGTAFVFVTGNTYTYSVYVKPIGDRNFEIGYPPTVFTGRFARFSLSGSGSVQGTDAGVTAFIQAVGDGWYRCSATNTCAAGAGSRIGNFINNASFSRNYAGDTAVGIYIWGAQVEQSATVGEYIPTTSTINSAPRFDHNPTTGESLGLLVEEARTNSIRNNTMVGAVAGTPGTLPTNWGIDVPGLTTSVIGTGTSNGISYIDIRLNGTTSASYGNIFFESSSGIAATNAQTWAHSLWLSTVGGTTTNLGTIRHAFDLYSSTSSYLTTVVSNLTGLSASQSRFSAALTTNNASTAFARPSLSMLWSSGAAIDITLRIGLPQLEQGAFATSVIPTTTATVTRAADVASITGSNFGVTRTNLLVRSEEFDDAAWTKGNSSITANTIVAPDGTLTADKLVEDTSSATHYARRSTSPTINTNPITFSVYVKAAERIYVGLAIQEATTFTRQSNVNFNLGSGTANTVSSIGGAGSASATIIPVGNGWYRCTLTTTLGGTDTNALSWIYVSTSSGFNYTGDGTSGIYLWGAQLEVGSAVTPYIQSPSVFTSRASSGTYVGGNGLIQTATTNEARYDHDPVSLISKGLLLEEARTNVVTWSQDFSQADWTKNASTVVTTAVASPIQGVNYQKIEATSANTTVGITSVAVTAATQQRAVSFFAQPLGNISRVLVVVQGADARINVNLADGTFTTNAAATGSTVAVSGQRFSVSTPTLTNATGVRFFLKQTGDTDTDTPTTIAIGEGLYLIGAQMEVGAFATSYIPTTTATVTRAADISTSVATSVFESSFYNQTEGTVFTDCSITYTVPGSLFPLVSSLNDGTSNNRIENGFLTSTLAGYEVVASGSAQVGVYPSAVSVLARRLATNYQLNNFAACVNGKSISTDTTGIVPTVSQLRIGDRAGGASTNVLNGTIKRLTYWPTRLGNEVLQRITQ
jgi:hypothetical protein